MTPAWNPDEAIASAHRLDAVLSFDKLARAWPRLKSNPGALGSTRLRRVLCWLRLAFCRLRHGFAFNDEACGEHQCADREITISSAPCATR